MRAHSVNGHFSIVCGAILALGIAVAGCRSTVSVIDGTLGGLGLEKPDSSEDVATEEIIRAKLPAIGEREMQRLNLQPELSHIVFTPTVNDPLSGGKYQKEQRVYERWYAGEISAGRRNRGTTTISSRSSERTGTYTATIEYRYRIRRTAEFSSREEAAAAAATDVDDEILFERYKYGFDVNGRWDSKPGRPTR
jgi:hypothetical protein